MRKFLSIIALSVTLTGCSFFKSTVSYTELSDKHYETIGVPFGEYVSNDTTATDEFQAQTTTVLLDWKTNTATVETYNFVATPYKTYVANDSTLDDSAKSRRFANVESWHQSILVNEETQ